MKLDTSSCYAALRTRDPRFDGLFYVGVTTTGIYCRPICPARTPARDRCEFFTQAAEAEHAGYRACFRCRPELAPGHAAVDATSRLVRTVSANALFQKRFARRPSAIRRDHGVSAPDAEAMSLRLDYRPPFDWEALLGFLRARAVPGVEQVAPGEYRRTVRLDEHLGWVAVSAEPGRNALVARVALSLAPRLMEVVARLRALFDMDARPDLIHGHLGLDPALKPLVAARPGLRVPGAFDVEAKRWLLAHERAARGRRDRARVLG